jgi:hypothetical protein
MDSRGVPAVLLHGDRLTTRTSLNPGEHFAALALLRAGHSQLQHGGFTAFALVTRFGFALPPLAFSVSVNEVLACSIHLAFHSAAVVRKRLERRVVF